MCEQEPTLTADYRLGRLTKTGEVVAGHWLGEATGWPLDRDWGR